MKIYILTKDSTRCFGDGTELHFNDRFICICTDLNTAKRAIDRHMEPYTNFGVTISGHNVGYADGTVYYIEYEDRYACGDKDIFKVIEKDIDDAPEVEENRSLKKQVKLLEEKVDDLKTRLNALTGSKATYTENTIKPKKEEKSNVRFDW